MGQIRLSAEDQFALLTPGLQGGAVPSSDEARNLGCALGELIRRHQADGAVGWEAVWDLRSIRGFGDRRLDDACASLRELMVGVGLDQSRQRVLVRPEESEALAWYMGWLKTSDPPDSRWSRSAPAVVTMRPKRLPRRTLDLQLFDDCDLLDPYEVFDDSSLDWTAYRNAAVDLGITTPDELEVNGQLAAPEWAAAGSSEPPLGVENPNASTLADLVWNDAVQERRVQVVQQALNSIAGNSLLVQIALATDPAGEIHVIPYHSYALHEVSTAGDDLFLMRPGRASGAYWSRFRSDIVRLESLLNDPRVRESEIEQVLLANPLFMRGLNYGEVYPQVVLPREGAPDFRPDVIAEPIGEQWTHIIDFKLPDKTLLVGSESRPQLSAALKEAAAQLREYRAYFDDRALAKRIEDQLGISCYKPKMVVIIGRDPTRFTLEQRRRAMTSEPDLEIITYDQLLRVSRDQSRIFL